MQAAEATARAFIEAPDEATRDAILRRAFDERVAHFRREMAEADRADKAEILDGTGAGKALDVIRSASDSDRQAAADLKDLRGEAPEGMPDRQARRRRRRLAIFRECRSRLGRKAARLAARGY